MEIRISWEKQTLVKLHGFKTFKTPCKSSKTYLISNFCTTTKRIVWNMCFLVPGWLSKPWFLNSAILPQLLAARLIIIMWAYHTFSLANFNIKCVLRGRRSSAGSFFSPRCSHWCYCCHYCYLHCCPCSPRLVHIVPIFILHCSAGSFAGWLSWAGLLDCLACGCSVLDCCGLSPNVDRWLS